MSSMQRLTLGLELEVIAEADNRHEPRDALRRRIAHAINVAGYVAAMEASDYTPGDTVWVIADDVTIIPDPPLWPRRYGVEIVSPPFLDVDDSSRDEWHREVSHVIQVVTSAFQVSTNKTTGYHVHIGIGKGVNDKFTLEDVKKISMMVLIYESDIDKMHADHRLQYYMANSNAENWWIEETGLETAFTLLVGAPSISQVQQLMCPSARSGTSPRECPNSSTREYKMNLLSLDKYGTIEFRQHEGTYDPSAICAWADFLLLFVRKALSLSFDEILAKRSAKGDISDIVLS